MAAKPTKSSGQKDNFTRNLVIGMVALVVGVGVIFSVTGNQTKVSSKIPTIASEAEGYGLVFNPSAMPVIDIWEDFQCPVCRSFESVVGSYLSQLVKENKAKVIYHPLSFIGPESVRAANAAACAAEESKFDEFHTLLYKTQSTTENSGLWSNDNLVGLGATVGLTSDSFKKCVNDGGFLGWVNNIAADGAKKNVNSTPTVFVNGKEIDRNTQYMDLNGFTAALVAAGLK
ncbi:MAG: hypothetical protein RJB28_144 [Actinomycetota bacterium]|jgi:protein-disulfide isomerase|nr:protein-disulfide isomerase [Actinomycetota bacterium]NDF10360.1 protein-disulfide isomerase [Actinomycetota bacterium]